MKQHDGCYRDALLNKKNEVEVILHESLGGGFSPPAVAAMHRNSKEARAIHGETSKSKADLTRLAGAVGALM